MSRLAIPNRHGSAHKKSFSKRTPNNKFGGLLSGSFAPMRHGAIRRTCGQSRLVDGFGLVRIPLPPPRALKGRITADGSPRGLRKLRKEDLSLL
jgi:hypothetical protein